MPRVGHMMPLPLGVCGATGLGEGAGAGTAAGPPPVGPVGRRVGAFLAGTWTASAAARTLPAASVSVIRTRARVVRPTCRIPRSWAGIESVCHPRATRPFQVPDPPLLRTTTDDASVARTRTRRARDAPTLRTPLERRWTDSPGSVRSTRTGIRNVALGMPPALAATRSWYIPSPVRAPPSVRPSHITACEPPLRTPRSRLRTTVPSALAITAVTLPRPESRYAAAKVDARPREAMYPRRVRRS